MMKYIVNLTTGQVQHVPNFESLPGIRSNGQHQQLPGFALVEFSLTPTYSELKLLHPETEVATGHVDVTVRYPHLECPTFHRYSGNEEFVPDFTDWSQNRVWPTGPWSLVKTVVAIEEYLEGSVGFTPMLQSVLLNRFSSEHFKKQKVH